MSQGRTGLPLCKIRRKPGFVPGTNPVCPGDKPGLSRGHSRGVPRATGPKSLCLCAFFLPECPTKNIAHDLGDVDSLRCEEAAARELVGVGRAALRSLSLHTHSYTSFYQRLVPGITVATLAAPEEVRLGREQKKAHQKRALLFLSADLVL